MPGEKPYRDDEVRVNSRGPLPRQCSFAKLTLDEGMPGDAWEPARRPFHGSEQRSGTSPTGTEQSQEVAHRQFAESNGSRQTIDSMVQDVLHSATKREAPGFGSPTGGLLARAAHTDSQVQASEGFEMDACDVEHMSEIDEWVTKDSTPWLSFLEEEQKRLCCNPDANVDKLMQDRKQRNKLDGTDNKDGLFNLLRNKSVICTLALLSVFYWYVLFKACSSLTDQIQLRGRAFRLEVLTSHGSSNNSFLASVSRIGLTLDGCEIPATSQHRSNNLFTMDFRESVEVNGWFVQTEVLDEPEMLPDAVLVRLQMSTGRDQAWLPLETDRNFPAGFAGTFALSSTWRIPLSEPGRIDRRFLPLHMCAVASTMLWFALAAGSTATCLLAARGCSLAARNAAGASLAVQLGLSWAMLAAELAEGVYVAAPAWRGVVTCTLLAPHVIFHLWPRRFLASVVLAACTHLALLSLGAVRESNLESWSAALLLLRSHELHTCFLALVAAASQAASQHRLYRRERAAVQEAKDMQQHVWHSQLLSLDAAEDTIDDLLEAVRRLARPGNRKVVQRLAEAAPHGDSLGSLHHAWGVGQLVGRRPLSSLDTRSGPLVMSLEQLYAQARACQVMMKEKVQQLGLASRGMFALNGMKKAKFEPSAVYVRWEEAQTEPEMRGSIQWTPLKAPIEAVDKVLSHYDGEVCRILDICRETIVFQDIADITSCLLAIEQDDELVVERVKNTLTSEPSHHPSGFRGVLLNLRVDTAASRALGVSGHVCELLLLPLTVACCLSEEDMKSFRRLRKAADARSAWPSFRNWRCSFHTDSFYDSQHPFHDSFLSLTSPSAASPARLISQESTVDAIIPVRVRSASQESTVEAIIPVRLRSADQPPIPGSQSRPAELSSPGRMSPPSSPRERRADRQSVASPTGRRRKGSDSSWSGTENAHMVMRKTKSAAGVSMFFGRIESAQADPDSDWRRAARSADSEPDSEVRRGATLLGRSRLLPYTPAFETRDRAAFRRAKSMGSGPRLPRLEMLAAGLARRPARSASPVRFHRGGALGRARSMESGLSPQELKMLATQLAARSERQPRRVGSARVASAEGDAKALKPEEDELSYRVATRPLSWGRSTGSVELQVRDSEAGPGRHPRGAGVQVPATLWGVARQLKTLLRPSMRRSSAVMRTASQPAVKEPEDWGRGTGWWYLSMEKLFRDKTLGRRKHVEGRIAIAAAVTDTEYLNVFQTSFPLRAALCKAWFRRLLLVLGLAYLVAGSFTLARVANEGKVQAKYLRLTASMKTARTAATENVSPSITALGIAKEHCREIVEAEHVEPNQWIVALENVTTVTGFFRYSPDRTAHADFEAFELHASLDAEHWELAASSHRHLHVGAYQWWSTEDAHPTEMETEVDFRPPWFVWTEAVSGLLLAFAWLVLHVCAIGHHHRIAEGLLQAAESGIDLWLSAGLWLGVLFLAGCAVCRLVALVARLHGGFLDHATEDVFYSLSSGALVAGVGCTPRQLWQILVFHAIVSICVHLHSAGAAGGGGAWLVVLGEVVPPVLMLLCILWVLVRHVQSKRSLQLKVAEDIAGYERLWDALRADRDEKEALAQLEIVVQDTRAEHQLEHAPAQRFRPSGRRGEERRWQNLNKAKLWQSSVKRALLLPRRRGESSSSGGILTRLGFRRSATSAASRARAASFASLAHVAQDSSNSGSPTNAQGRRPPPPRGLSCSSPVDSDNAATSSCASPQEPATQLRSCSSHARQPAALEPPPSDPDSPRLGPTPFNGVPSLPTQESQALPLHADGRRAELQALTRLREEASFEGHALRRRTSLLVRIRSSPTRRRSSQPLPRRHQRRLSLNLGSSPVGLASEDRSPLATSTPTGRGFRRVSLGSSPSGRAGSGAWSQVLTRMASVASGIQRIALPSTVCDPDKLRAEEHPVESLEQLYAQAATLHPILKAKVQGWAHASEGCFPLRLNSGGRTRMGEWQLLVEVHGKSEAEARVKWGELKALSRAKEKLVRSYQGQPSRLLDICRQSIVFRSTHNLVECLLHVTSDPDVVVVSIKNRLSEGFPARAQSLGYRDVNLGIRFDSARTRALGVDLHICELQLLLEPFAKLKSEDGHRRYIVTRNARGQ